MAWRITGGRSHPTAAWTAQQLREAFPSDDAPRYLLRDHDTAFHAWATTATAMGIDEILTAVRSPWQNAYAERLIGSIRRECLDHVVIGNERGLRRVLHAYVEYYLRSRTHLSSIKMHRSRGRSRRLTTATSWQFPRSVASTTATNAAPRSSRNLLPCPRPFGGGTVIQRTVTFGDVFFECVRRESRAAFASARPQR